MTGEKMWAAIRQVAIGATDLDATTAQLREAYGLGRGVVDPLLEDIGVADETIPVGTDAYLEVVAPMRPEGPLHKWLDKHGEGGYVASIQVPQIAPLLANAERRGVRIGMDLEAYGRRIVQLHPGDMGLLVELDEVPEREQWFWDDFDKQVPPAPVVDDIVSIDVQSPDPQAQADLWAAVFGIEVQQHGGHPSIALGERIVHFVRGERKHLAGIGLKRVAGADGPDELTVSGVTIRLH